MKRLASRPLFRSRRRAALLVLTLWISIVLSMMAFSLANDLRIDMKLTSVAEKRFKARALARAGLAKAVVDLRNDRTLTIADPAAGRADSYADIWADVEDKTDMELGEGTYTVRATDEGSKINLTQINPRNAVVLAYIVAELADMDILDATDIALMVADWQDPDDLPAGGAGASERSHWTEIGLENFSDGLPEDWSFEPRNDQMLTLGELLQIPGITREVLYGDPLEEEDRGIGLRRRRNRREEDPDERGRRLADYVTVGEARTLNLNTIPSLTLEALLGAATGAGGGSVGLAREILDLRAQLRESPDDGGGFVNPQQQLLEAGIPQEAINTMRQFFPLNVSSTYYEIEATGIYAGIRKTLRAKVNVQPDAFQLEGGGSDGEGRRDPEVRPQIRTRLQFVIDPAARVYEIQEF